MASRTAIVPEPSFEESGRIRAFWDAHWERFLRDYPDQFVAVNMDSGAVVVADRDLLAHAERLGQLGLDPCTDVAIEFVSVEVLNLIL